MTKLVLATLVAATAVLSTAAFATGEAKEEPVMVEEGVKEETKAPEAK